MCGGFLGFWGCGGFLEVVVGILGRLEGVVVVVGDCRWCGFVCVVGIVEECV